jgi:hypothetical protein
MMKIIFGVYFDKNIFRNKSELKQKGHEPSWKSSSSSYGSSQLGSGSSLKFSIDSFKVPIIKKNSFRRFWSFYSFK